VVYERALAAFPLTHFLWLTYTRYLEAHLKIPAIVNAVFARAVRNTPWVGAVWARALNALERSCAPDDEQSDTYQRATSASLQVRFQSPKWSVCNAAVCNPVAVLQTAYARDMNISGLPLRLFPSTAA